MRERRKKSQCVDPRRGTDANWSVQDTRHLTLQVLKQALDVDCRHAASVLLAVAG